MTRPFTTKIRLIRLWWELSVGPKVDYFGYLKKMALTLHNLIQIERGNLPIHGAMAHVVLRDGHSANIVLMGTVVLVNQSH